MTQVSVRIDGLAGEWKQACRRAVTDLNKLFTRKGIQVKLSIGSGTPTIVVKLDGSISAHFVHGKTSAATDGSGKLVRAKVGLPEKVSISVPSGPRDAGVPVLEVIAAHEFVHALGDTPHTSHLMTQTLYKEGGDKPSDDRLLTGRGKGAVALPPLSLSPKTVKTLKQVWS